MVEEVNVEQIRTRYYLRYRYLVWHISVARRRGERERASGARDGRRAAAPISALLNLAMSIYTPKKTTLFYF